jgi:excisionase family DNA binding protein
MPDEIMTLKDVSEYLKIAEKTLYGYVQKGQIPGIKIGSAWRFRKSEIDAWLDDQRKLTEESTRTRVAKVKNKVSESRGVGEQGRRRAGVSESRSAGERASLRHPDTPPTGGKHL